MLYSLNTLREEYKSGKMTSGEIKELACGKITGFMSHLTKNIEKAGKGIAKLKFVTFK